MKGRMPTYGPRVGESDKYACTVSPERGNVSMQAMDTARMSEVSMLTSEWCEIITTGTL